MKLSMIKFGISGQSPREMPTRGMRELPNRKFSKWGSFRRGLLHSALPFDHYSTAVGQARRWTAAAYITDQPSKAVGTKAFESFEICSMVFFSPSFHHIEWGGRSGGHFPVSNPHATPTRGNDVAIRIFLEPQGTCGSEGGARG